MAKRKPRPRGHGDGSIVRTEYGTWQAYFSGGVLPNGKRARQSKTFPTYPEAADWLALMRSGKGGDAATRLTVGQWQRSWLAAKKESVEWETYRWYRTHADRLVGPRIGAARLADLTAAKVRAWMESMSEDGVEPGPRKNALKVLRAMLTAAVEEELITRNAAKLVKGPKVPKPKHMSLTAEQARVLLEVAEGTRFAAFWRLALDSGCRPGELLAMTWEDFDEARGSVRVRYTLEYSPERGLRRKEPKTAAGRRTVPIAPSTAAALVAHRARAGRLPAGPGDPIFPGEKGALLRISHVWERYWEPLRERAAGRGVPRCRMYDLRHTSASLLLSRGVSIRVVAARLGHESPAVTLKFYLHALPDDIEAVRGVAETLFG